MADRGQFRSALSAPIERGARRARRRALSMALGLSLGMGATSGLAELSRPTRRRSDERRGLSLESLAPLRFGPWAFDRSMSVLVPPPDQQAALDRLYHQTLARAYVGGGAVASQRVMLSLAYGGDQSDGLSVHLPEVCYAGQGFRVERLHDAQQVVAGRALPVRRMMTVRGRRHEPVSYWVTTCGEATVSAWRRRVLGLREGLRGRIPDALLVRASTIDVDAERGWRVQARFLDDLAREVPQAWRGLLVGDAVAELRT